MKLKLIVLSLLSISFSDNIMAKDLFIIKDIRVEGLKVIDPTTIFGYMPVKIGDKFTDTKGEQIIKKLYSTGYFDDINVETSKQDVLVTVKERPIIGNLYIKGGKTISNSELKKNFNKFGVGSSKVYNPSLLNQLIFSLKQEYISKGKNNAEIITNISQLERNRINIEINIKEGKTTRIKNIQFEGNKVFSARRLKKQLSLSKKSFITILTKSDLFSPEKFNEDQKKLIDYYKDRGYADFKITGVDIQRIDNDEYGIGIHFNLYEGDKYKFGDISLTGDVKDVPLKDLQHILKQRKKKIFSRNRWFNNSEFLKIISEIKDKMGEYGYSKAKVDVESSKDGDIINFILNIIPNNKIYVNQINIVGNNKTRDEVIRREFRQLESSVYNLKKINRSKDRIETLGFFEKVDIKEIPIQGDPNTVNLETEVKELSTGSLEASVGYVQDDGVTLLAGFSQDNLFGTGKSVSARAVTGGSTKNISLSFTDPYFTKDNVSLGYDIFWRSYDPNKIDTSAYKMKSIGGDLNFGVPVSEIDKIIFGIGIKRTNLTLYDRSPLYYRQFVSNYGNKFTVYTGNIGWGRNTTDSYIWPTKGYIINASLDFDFPGSKYEYYGVSHNQTWFFPITNSFTLMLGGSLGFLYSYGKTKEVPFFQNYYGGGIGSVRGYDSNSLGPKINDWYGSVDYLGGTKMARTSAELLFPFPGMKDNRTVRVSLFADAGSVWDGKKYNYIDFIEYEGPHSSTFNNELRYSVGAAFTWISPLGPMKFSYGFPLRKKKGDRLQRFQFQIGTVF